jgi:hypothetical protein
VTRYQWPGRSTVAREPRAVGHQAVGPCCFVALLLGPRERLPICALYAEPSFFI